EADSRTILAACTSLSPLSIKILQESFESLECLIFAPDSEAAGFDEFGQIKPDYWLHRDTSISPSILHFSRSDLELSEEIATASQTLINNGIPPEHITLGMTNPELIAPSLYELERLHISGTAPGTKNLKQSLLGSFILGLVKVWSQ